MHWRAFLGAIVVVLCLGTATMRADEIRLKDGTKITGTIVGFENDSFRVETTYGFALVRKDKVADINITANSSTPTSESKKELESKRESETKTQPESRKDLEPKAASTTAAMPSASTSAPLANASPDAASTVLKKSSLHASDLAPLKPPQSETVRVGGISSTAVKIDAPDAKTKIVALTPPPPPVAPALPEPLVVHDEIRGNLYINSTYGFQMYKPPSWEIIPGARRALPDAVAALGTYDQTTLLVIGREHTKDSLDAHATATGKALSDVYENYRLISSKRVTIAGIPAMEQHARGTADGRDWSVVMVTFLKADSAYTLLGMTWADSDLIQVQENVISKTLNSLKFSTQ